MHGKYSQYFNNKDFQLINLVQLAKSYYDLRNFTDQQIEDTFEINNFKYTLYDLISMYSKYRCKMNTYFLGLFLIKLRRKNISKIAYLF